MNKLIFSISFFLIFKSNSIFCSSLDSLRLEKKDGKNFVIHKVTKGQTIFALLRKYGSTLSEFKASNPDLPLDLSIGQILKVPYGKPIKANIEKSKPIVVSKNTTAILNNPASTKDVEPETVTKRSAPKTFKVGPGMTLFSIAKKHSLTLSQLKRLNNLNSDGVVIGQILIVQEGEIITIPKPKGEIIAQKEEKKIPEKPIEIAKAEPKKSDIIVVETKPVITEKKIEPKKTIEDSPKSEVKVSEVEKVAPKIEAAIDTVKPFGTESGDTERKVKVEEGIAELIQVESKSGKYLALHKSAPLGTLVQVRNETNGASVWVKVIGRLPELDQNQNIIIKLSPKAMDRVSPVDKKFRAKINYSL